MVTEFQCNDCGAYVYSILRDATLRRFFTVGFPRCAICSAIRDMQRPHREEARAFLWRDDPAAWDHWRSIGAYRDESYLPRPCDHCGQMYRGPAVYCSLDCAMADA